MHQSALKYGKLFFEKYFKNRFTEQLLIVDVGAQDVNGSLKQYSPVNANYVGVDFAEGKGVDIVITDPYNLPFKTGTIDAVVCSSVFEHSEFFWLLFQECLRVIKPNGLIYVNAPSNGMIHRYPIDGWRFYPDAGHSLVNWAKKFGEKPLLLESFIAPKLGTLDSEGMWNDFVAVFIKDECYSGNYVERILDSENEATGAYSYGRVISQTSHELSPDTRQHVAQLKALREEQAAAQLLRTSLIEEQASSQLLRTSLIEEQASSQLLRTSLIEEQAAAQLLSTSLIEEQASSQLLRNENTEIRDSSSWRITRPMRWIGTTILKFQKKLLSQSHNNIAVICINSTNSDSTTISKIEDANDFSFDVLSGKNPKITATPSIEDKSKLIAFYLPQYHRIAENSEWWGPGFTEWTNVVKAKPNYEGHYQPHLPRELGFYDLSNVEVMREQADLAKIYGIGAFCFYYYWFSGRRILENPIDNFFESNIDMDYCLCWANENWTRTWDGDSRSVLMEQKYLEKDPLDFIESLLKYFKDPRYIRVDGKPMLIVYRAKDIPNSEKVFDIWRNAAITAGFLGVHIVAVDFYDINRPDEVGADALVEFPPHKFNGPQCVPDRLPKFINNDFSGGIVDYAKVMAQSANRLKPDFTLYRAILPSWDNTARRQNTPTIIYGSNPELFSSWLSYLRTYTRNTFREKSDPFIFINAWNEWGEGCHLEPDQKWGLQYLEGVKKSLWYSREKDNINSARHDLLTIAAKSVILREFDKPIDDVVLSSVMGSLIDTKAPSNLVQKIAFRLRCYPVAHWIGKSIYRSFRFLG
ncbi:MAG: glycoside hydrolase family 99-like domain-containing protein [Glaciimonas sp.]|nr:glycoside hydrolase family 99-like domain-containing protein [Glaciimonas sp.]